PRILVSLHCFFDAPHGYRWLLFPDILCWVEHLLEKASETEFDWYVKPHPQGRVENDAIIESLKRRFPKIKFLGLKVSNKQIAEEGINAVFTMYGTIGHELAYLGIPVVNAGDNPHIAYDFNYHPRTIDEFDQLIAKADALSRPANKDEVLEFFYLH